MNNNGDAISFFKIFLKESQEYLPLPSAFAKKYLEKGTRKKQTVVLKTQSDVKWRVEYLKIEDIHIFMNGWLKFTKDNRLQNGDLLVFWLLSPSPNPTFQVFLYAPDGCLKNPTTSHHASRNKHLVKEEASDDDDDDLLKEVQHTFTKVLKKSYFHRMPMANRFVKATGMNGYGSVQLKNSEGKTWEVEVKTYEPQKSTRLAAGWSDFRMQNGIMIGNTCEFHHVESNLFHVRVLKKRGRKCTKVKFKG